LPRVGKGYSDTLSREIAADEKINDSIVMPAIQEQCETEMADALRENLTSALKCDYQQSLNETVVNPTLR